MMIRSINIIVIFIKLLAPFVYKLLLQKFVNNGIRLATAFVAAEFRLSCAYRYVVCFRYLLLSSEDQFWGVRL